MKVIDKTPFQDEKGNSGLWQRFQGMLEYGSSWHSEIEAQKTVVSQLERVLEKGFTLVRNLNLENSKIIEPLILAGPPGVFVLYVTPVSGFFEAKGDEWNVIKNVYLNRQGVHLPGVVEPVLIATSPGVHIESLHPIVRVVLSDAIKQFGASLLQARPLLRPEVVHDVVDRLINPRSKTSSLQLEPILPGAESADKVADKAAEPVKTDEAPQRARAIFHAAEEAKPFDPADLSFQFNEKGAAQAPAGVIETSPSHRLEEGVSPRRLSPRQWLVLVGLLLVELLVLSGFVYLFLFGRR
jgi:hypothetical protein